MSYMLFNVYNEDSPDQVFAEDLTLNESIKVSEELREKGINPASIGYHCNNDCLRCPAFKRSSCKIVDELAPPEETS